MPGKAKGKVEKWGTGRRDNSQAIEESVQPLPMTHQDVTTVGANMDLSDYDSYTIENESKYGTVDVAYTWLPPDNYVLYTLGASLDRNRLMKAYFSIIDIDTGAITHYLAKYGYGKVEFKFPEGYVVDKRTAGITTYMGHKVLKRVPCISLLPGGFYTRISHTYLKEHHIKGEYFYET